MVTMTIYMYVVTYTYIYILRVSLPKENCAPSRREEMVTWDLPNDCCGLANTAGVFHLRSPAGKYKMNFSEADSACQADGATLASFKQLGDAQQVKKNI